MMEIGLFNAGFRDWNECRLKYLTQGARHLVNERVALISRSKG